MNAWWMAGRPNRSFVLFARFVPPCRLLAQSRLFGIAIAVTWFEIALTRDAGGRSQPPNAKDTPRGPCSNCSAFSHHPDTGVSHRRPMQRVIGRRWLKTVTLLKNDGFRDFRVDG